jgi:hypothetical protein
MRWFLLISLLLVTLALTPCMQSPGTDNEALVLKDMWGKVMDEVKGMKNAVQHKIDQLQDEMKKKMVEVWEMVG